VKRCHIYFLARTRSQPFNNASRILFNIFISKHLASRYTQPTSGHQTPPIEKLQRDKVLRNIRTIPEK
jgi:hypothetical protein